MLRDYPINKSFPYLKLPKVFPLMFCLLACLFEAECYYVAQTGHKL